MEVKAALIPKVIKFGFKDVEINDRTIRAQCNFCKDKAIISDKPGVTSNFLKHLQRMHPERHQEYRNSNTNGLDSGRKQQQITTAFTPTRPIVTTYSSTNSQQKAISSALIQDLIINCSLPLSVVENSHFRHFLSIIVSRFVPPARTTITSRLNQIADSLQTSIRNQLSSAKSVNATLDIWSDRRMRSYLGVTCHYISVDKFTLSSALLSCTRFSGSHTGDRIAAEIEAVLDMYGIKQKVDYFLTDNAANMKKAFTVTFMDCDADAIDGTDQDDDVDHPDMWEMVDDNTQQEILGTLVAHARNERLSCFDHTLHLVVGDGLKDTKCVSACLAKSCKISSLLHTSSSFRDSFENAFGHNVSIPAAVSTRWNSTLRQIKSVVGLDAKQLSDILEQQGQKNLIFSARELSQLSELIEILDPFLEATCLTEGDKVATISFVLPSVLALFNHLQDVKPRIKFCHPICKALLSSMESRFDGIFQRCHVPITQRLSEFNSLPFGSDIYILSTFFDPNFKLQWIENEIRKDDKHKQDLRDEVKGIVQKFVEDTNRTFHIEDMATSAQVVSEEIEPVPAKKPKLFAKYRPSVTSGRTHPTNITAQIANYLDMIGDPADDDNCMSFWDRHRLELNKLLYPAARALSVPASSSPVERVFSQGGIILNPHRARMSDSLLTKLIFLKCNNGIDKH